MTAAISEPAACLTCYGEQVVPGDDEPGEPPYYPCPSCCCETCTQPTNTPPECSRCATAEDRP